MSAPSAKPMTAEAFVEWAMQQPRRYELAAGEIVAMAPERVEHGLLKGHLLRRFLDEIDRRDLPCQAFVDGMAVRVDDDTVYEPDILVRCGPKLDLLDTMVHDPQTVVEIASPFTQSLDAGEKLDGYFKILGLRHYVIVRPRTRVVLHHERRDEHTILTHILRDGRLSLDPPGLHVPDVFAPLRA